MKAKLLIISFILIVLQGCIVFYSKMSHLSEADLEWLKPYENNDTLRFKSKTGKESFLVVASLVINNSTDRIAITDNPPLPCEYTANADVLFHICGDSMTIQGLFLIKKPISKDSLMVSARIGNRTTNVEKNKYGQILKSRKFELNDKIMDDCLVFNQSNTRLLGGNSSDSVIVDEFVFNKEHGLIIYTLDNGEIYTQVGLGDNIRH